MRSEIVTIKGYWAPKNLELNYQFLEGHRNVLKEHGFTHFKSNEQSWFINDKVFVLVALIDNIVVGGIRLEIRTNKGTLSLEKAIEPIDSSISVYLDKLPTNIIIETCGLWNSRSIAGFNISQFLTRLGVVLSYKIDPNAVSFCFNATYTFRITRSLGYEMVKSLGDDGYMNYPTPDFKAALWQHSDLEKLSRASEHENERILSLRENINQEYIEKNKFGGIKVIYEIIL